MKKLLALMMALVMVMSLCSCGNGEETKEEATIIGKWTAEIDFASIMDMSQELASLDEEVKALIMPKGVSMKLFFEFDDNGIASIFIDIRTAADDYLGQVAANLTDYLKKTIEDQGVSAEVFDAAVGMSLEDYVSFLMSQQFSGVMDTLPKELETPNTGEYKLEGDKLYWGEDGVFDGFFTIKLDDNKFTINSVSTSDEADQLFIGLTFTRQ